MERLLSFVQFEHPGRLGLDDGRYVIRDPEEPEAPEQVIVVQTLGAPHPSRQRKRRQRPGRVKKAAGAEPPEVPVTRSTVIDSKPLGDEKEAERWLKATAGTPRSRADRAREALDLLNRALATLRRHAEDPLVGDASFHHALTVRIGYGTGQQVADGEWTDAREMPDSPSPRHADLEAQRKTARELAGRTDEDEDQDEDAGDSEDS